MVVSNINDTYYTNKPIGSPLLYPALELLYEFQLGNVYVDNNKDEYSFVIIQFAHTTIMINQRIVIVYSTFNLF